VAADDLIVTPAYLPDLADEVLDRLVDGECGVWHPPSGPMTWADLARTAALGAGLAPTGVVPRPAAAFRWPATRPAYSELGSTRGLFLPPLADSLVRFSRDFDPQLFP